MAEAGRSLQFEASLVDIVTARRAFNLEKSCLGNPQIPNKNAPALKECLLFWLTAGPGVWEMRSGIMGEN